jgi:hypothetical protein
MSSSKRFEACYYKTSFFLIIISLAGAVELATDGGSSNGEATSLSITGLSIEVSALRASLDTNLLVAGGHDNMASVDTR